MMGSTHYPAGEPDRGKGGHIMALIRWTDPFRDIEVLQDRMNRLFGGFLDGGHPREEVRGTGIWMPNVDIYETKDAICVRAELPGVDKDAVNVEVKEGVLTLRGERKFEKEVKEENYHRIEQSYGTFHRSFRLPSSVEEGKVSARLKEGVLEVDLPKKEQAKPKQIEIAA
jgi:HSP20 family protein